MNVLPKIFTPYLRPLSNDANTIVFKSADNQISALNGNTGRRYKFSKYALLNLPDIVRPTNGKNNIQLDALEGAYATGLSSTPGSAGDNIDLVQSLQNYALNMESLLLSNPEFDLTTHQTVAERVLFKWLKEIGAVRWEENTADVASTVTDTKFAEHPFNDDFGSGILYEPVVKFIGEIDIQGDLYSNFGSKQQIYFYIPSQVGSSPKVLFKSVIDDNYYPSQIIKQPTIDDIEYIQGSTAADEPTPAGLTVFAFYDLDVPAGSFDYTVNGDPVNSWFDTVYDSSIVNSYLTDINEGDTTLDLITRENTDTTNHIEWYRSRLDCVQIDFDKANYKAFEDDVDLKSLIDFATTTGSTSFSFNAIAIYYDIIENDAVLATNLYGITFLGNLSPTSGSGSMFKSYYKSKPDSVLGVSGNGYGFILNINRDGNNNNTNTIVNVSINDYNTFSMQLFAKALLQMNVMTSRFEELLLLFNRGVTKMNQLEEMLINDDNKIDILAQISSIRNILGSSTTNAALVDLISRQATQIQGILAGNTSVSVDLLYNFLSFDGLQVKEDKINKTLQFRDTKESYSYNQLVILDTDANQDIQTVNVVKLQEKSGLVIHRNDGVAKDLYQHVSIRVSEAENRWKTNQSMEIVFDDIINFNNKIIKIFTGVNDAYEVIGSVSQGKSFTIICVNEITRDFIIKQ